MAQRTFTVTATWDSEASVWVATGDDVPGLVAEAPTPDDLLTKLRTLVSELLELNGHLVDGGTPPISVRTHFDEFERELEIA